LSTRRSGGRPDRRGGDAGKCRSPHRGIGRYSRFARRCCGSQSRNRRCGRGSRSRCRCCRYLRRRGGSWCRSGRRVGRCRRRIGRAQNALRNSRRGFAGRRRRRGCFGAAPQRVGAVTGLGTIAGQGLSCLLLIAGRRRRRRARRQACEVGCGAARIVGRGRCRLIRELAGGSAVTAVAEKSRGVQIRDCGTCGRRNGQTQDQRQLAQMDGRLGHAISSQSECIAGRRVAPRTAHDPAHFLYRAMALVPSALPAKYVNS